MPKVSIYNGVSKKTDKPYKAVLVEIGEWSTLHFPNSKFEMDYIEKKLGEENKADSQFNLDEE